MAPRGSPPESQTVLPPHAAGEPLAAQADLASRWVGGSVIAASDESFGEKECLRGGLGQFEAVYLMPLMLAHAERLGKFGA